MFFYTNGKFICKRHIMYILFCLQTLKDTTVVNVIGYQNFYINCLCTHFPSNILFEIFANDTI